jgi:hypothetical protein
MLAISLLRCFAPAILPRRRQPPTAVARRLGVVQVTGSASLSTRGSPLVKRA